VDGIHDVGGMEGFGPVVVEDDEPVFHHRWEQRVFGMNFSAVGVDADRFRHAIERMDPAAYLATSYYEHWLHAIETLVVEAAGVPPEQLAEARRQLAAVPDPSAAVPHHVEPAWAVALVAAVTTPPPPPAAATDARWPPGARVRVRRHIVSAHTRCPRYVRGAVGVVEAVRGVFRLPDASVAGDPDRREAVYSVRFEAEELWGAPGHRVGLDLWESYLEDAG